MRAACLSQKQACGLAAEFFISAARRRTGVPSWLFNVQTQTPIAKSRQGTY